MTVPGVFQSPFLFFFFLCVCVCVRVCVCVSGCNPKLQNTLRRGTDTRTRHSGSALSRLFRSEKTTQQAAQRLVRNSGKDSAYVDRPNVFPVVGNRDKHMVELLR